jgi:hypothetical protein
MPYQAPGLKPTHPARALPTAGAPPRDSAVEAYQFVMNGIRKAAEAAKVLARRESAHKRRVLVSEEAGQSRRRRVGRMYQGQVYLCASQTSVGKILQPLYRKASYT